MRAADRGGVVLRLGLAVAAMLLMAVGSAVASAPAAFSPDGDRVAIAGPDGLRVGAVGAAGDVIDGARDCAAPVWSPNGRYLAYVRGTGAGAQLVLYTLSSRRARALGNGYAPPITWREDSGRIAALHLAAAGAPEIAVYDLSEKGLTLRVACSSAVPAPSDDTFVWLPGTDDVAYLSTAGDVHTIESGEAHRISTGADVVGLGLSADRRKLIWARRSANPRYIALSLYAYDLSSRSVARLPFPARVPLISPNPRTGPDRLIRVVMCPTGTQLAARYLTSATKKAPARYAWYAVRLDGSGARALGPAAAAPGEVVWSPDGRKVATIAAGGGTSTFTLR